MSIFIMISNAYVTILVALIIVTIDSFFFVLQALEQVMSITRQRYKIFASKVNELEKIVLSLKVARAKLNATCTRIKEDNVPLESEVCSTLQVKYLYSIII